MGPDDPSTAETITGLASLLLTKGDLAKAEPLFRRALAVNVRILAGSGTGGFAPGVGPGGEKKSGALAVHVEAGILSILP